MADTIEKLKKQIEKLTKQNADLQKQINEYQKPKETNREYKDRLFKFIFGNPENRQWTLSLYNAINGTDYTDPNIIQYNTIDDAVYMGMHNDISFIVIAEMSLWEHQSTFNPNMPMRFLNYGNQLYEKYIATTDYYPYSETLQKIPRPVCICFYNGTREEPDRKILRLSQAYEGEGDIEVTVTMLNINHGKNKKLMEACEPLSEYAWLVDAVRRHQKEKMNLDVAVDASLDEMPENFVIRSFLLGNRAEVKNMLLTEYNQEKVMQKERQEGRKEERRDMAIKMIRANEPDEKIVAYTGLSAAEVNEIRETQLITV